MSTLPQPEFTPQMLWIPECGREEFRVFDAAVGIPRMDSAAAAAAAELQTGLCIIKGHP